MFLLEGDTLLRSPIRIIMSVCSLSFPFAVHNVKCVIIPHYSDENTEHLRDQRICPKSTRGEDCQNQFSGPGPFGLNRWPWPLGFRASSGIRCVLLPKQAVLVKDTCWQSSRRPSVYPQNKWWLRYCQTMLLPRPMC